MTNLIPCRHEVTGHETDLPTGWEVNRPDDVHPAWRALGWKPVSEYPKPQAPEPAAEATTKPATRAKRDENKE